MRCKVSIRLPPTLNGEKASKIITEKLLEKKDDTFNATINLDITSAGNGLDAPKLPEDIQQKFFDAHKVVFGGNEPISIGCGGSIPFMEVFS